MARTRYVVEVNVQGLQRLSNFERRMEGVQKRQAMLSVRNSYIQRRAYQKSNNVLSSKQQAVENLTKQRIDRNEQLNRSLANTPDRFFAVAQGSRQAGWSVGTTNTQMYRTYQITGMLGRKSNVFQQWSRRFQSMSRSIVWINMSMLGVFFSMFGLVNMLMMVTNLIFSPLKNLSNTIKELAYADAFKDKTGFDPDSLFGENTADFISNKLVPAWENFKGIMGWVSSIFANLAVNVFGDEDFIDKFSEKLTTLGELSNDPKIVGGFQNLVLFLFGLAEGLAQALPKIGEATDAFAPFSEQIGTLAGYSMLFMPVVASIGLFVSVLRGLTTLLGVVGGGASVSGSIASVGASLLGFIPILLASVGFLLYYKKQVGSWAQVWYDLKVVLWMVKTGLEDLWDVFEGFFNWIDEKWEKIKEFFEPVTTILGKIVPDFLKPPDEPYLDKYMGHRMDMDWLRYQYAKDTGNEYKTPPVYIPGGSYPTPSQPNVTNVDITQYNTNNISEEVDAEKVLELWATGVHPFMNGGD